MQCIVNVNSHCLLCHCR